MRGPASSSRTLSRPARARSGSRAPRAARDDVRHGVGAQFTTLMGGMRRRLRRAASSPDAQQRAYRHLLSFRKATDLLRDGRRERRCGPCVDHRAGLRTIPAARRWGKVGPCRRRSRRPRTLVHPRTRAVLARRRRRVPRRGWSGSRGSAALRSSGTNLSTPAKRSGRRSTQQSGHQTRARSFAARSGEPDCSAQGRRSLPLRSRWGGGRRHCSARGSPGFAFIPGGETALHWRVRRLPGLNAGDPPRRRGIRRLRDRSPRRRRSNGAGRPGTERRHAGSYSCPPSWMRFPGAFAAVLGPDRPAAIRVQGDDTGPAGGAGHQSGASRQWRVRPAFSRRRRWSSAMWSMCCRRPRACHS